MFCGKVVVFMYELSIKFEDFIAFIDEIKFSWPLGKIMCLPV